MRDRLSDPVPVAGDIVNDPSSFWHGAEVVSVYTRAQAIADGVLVDLTPIARSNGIRLPVALTSASWKVALCEPRADGMPSGIDVGRFLFWLRVMLSAANPSADQIDVPFTRINGTATRLKIVCGPGDAGEPVLTVMLPSES